jgi:hypothetical protein
MFLANLKPRGVADKNIYDNNISIKYPVLYRRTKLKKTGGPNLKQLDQT